MHTIEFSPFDIDCIIPISQMSKAVLRDFKSIHLSLAV